MKNKGFMILLIGYTLIMFILTFTLNETIPVHWNSNFEVDGYGSKYLFLFFVFMPIIIYYGFLFTKNIDPKKSKLIKSEHVYELYHKGLTFFFMLLGIFFYYMTISFENDINIGQRIGFILYIMQGILFIGMGNYMPKVPQNHFLGIRTPWTIENEVVWKKTHRKGGILFCLIGLYLMIIAFNINRYTLIGFVGILIMTTIYLYVYSYYINKQESRG